MIAASPAALLLFGKLRRFSMRRRFFFLSDTGAAWLKILKNTTG
jgi:hypothetical protein